MSAWRLIQRLLFAVVQPWMCFIQPSSWTDIRCRFLFHHFCKSYCFQRIFILISKSNWRSVINNLKSDLNSFLTPLRHQVWSSSHCSPNIRFKLIFNLFQRQINNHYQSTMRFSLFSNFIPTMYCFHSSVKLIFKSLSIYGNWCKLEKCGNSNIETFIDRGVQRGLNFGLFFNFKGNFRSNF